MSATDFACGIAARSAPLAGFQSLLSRCPTSSDRKRLVLAAWECGALSRAETGLLVQAHMLETA